VKIGLLIDRLDLLPSVASWGYDYAEIVPDLLGAEAPDARAAEAFARIAASPVPVATMCGFLPNPAERHLMVVGPQVDRRRLRAYVTEVFAGMQRAGISVIGFGSGSARWVPDGFPIDRAMAQVDDFLSVCAELGEARGIRVALEPYNRQDANLVNTVPEALAVVQRISRPTIQLMADFFHMVLNGESLAELEEAAPRLIHAHIAEPGRGRPPTTPADHAAFLGTLRRIGYDGPVTQTGPLPAYASPTEAAAALKRFAREGEMS
jgi:D-psicose/D-tagatose/L-ribulose 3-epimerase